MTPDETEFLEWGFKGFVGIAGVTLSAFTGWIMRRLNALDSNHDVVAKDLNDHKLYVALNLPTKMEVDRAIVDTKDGIKRINERLDALFEKAR